MEDNILESWKNKEIFDIQLKLNLKELNGNYPSHWVDFIQFIKIFKPNNMLDIGCGCGAFSELCTKEFPELKYVGVDYAEEAIEIAKEQWEQGAFMVKDYKELDEKFISEFDLVHMGALLDVLPNGDEALEYILSLSPKQLLIGRMRLTDSGSHNSQYLAYDKITTYAFNHNKENFIKLCEKYNYEMLNLNNNFYLKKQ
jgi:trans-aconitate methyltransferase